MKIFDLILDIGFSRKAGQRELIKVGQCFQPVGIRYEPNYGGQAGSTVQRCSHISDADSSRAGNANWIMRAEIWVDAHGDPFILESNSILNGKWHV